MSATAVEGIIGLIASVCAIIGAIVVMARWLGRKFDRWSDAVIENSSAVKDLTLRVTFLEGAISKMNGGNQ